MSVDGNGVSLAVHEEFEQRMNDNIRMQNEQIKEIKGRLDDTHEMVTSVASLASSMEAMAKEQSRQGSDIREIRSKVESINHIEIKVNEHDSKLQDHDNRIRAQELKPQDSEKLASEVQALSQDNIDTKRRLGTAEKQLLEHKAQLNDIQKEPAENWKKAVWIVISCAITAAVTMVWTGVIGG